MRMGVLRVRVIADFRLDLRRGGPWVVSMDGKEAGKLSCGRRGAKKSKNGRALSSGGRSIQAVFEVAVANGRDIGLLEAEEECWDGLETASAESGISGAKGEGDTDKVRYRLSW